MKKETTGTALILKNALILTLITLIAGLALAFVYQLTLEPIAAAEAEAALSAYRTVFADAADFEVLDVTPGGENGVTVDACARAVSPDGQTLGWALTVTSPNGYGGDVTLALGVDPDGTLVGVSVIAQGETAGLGANCVKPSFLGQFAGIAGGEVAFTKTGKTQAHEIDAISGATITTRAVTEAVNAGLRYAYANLLPPKDGTPSEGGDSATEGGMTP